MVRNLATHRCVVAFAERETLACGRMGYLLPEIFPLVGRSNRGDSKGGVACPKKLSENFSSSRGDLMTTEDSRDGGGVACEDPGKVKR